MDPSTEQLIRDYLNRLAVAARSSMGTDELRAFLARIHDLIRRQCEARGAVSPADVGAALAALGMPQAVVDRERARLAAARPDAGTARSPYPADPAATDPSFAIPSLVTTHMPAVVPGRPAVVPSRPAVVPSRPAVVPSRPAVVPSRPAVVPGRPAAPARPRAAAQPPARPPAETGSLPVAPGTDGLAAGNSGGRLVRFPGKPRRNAGQRGGSQGADAGPGPGKDAEPGTDEGAGSALTGGQQAVQRRPLTARRKPAEILTDKPADKVVVRPRGPQGRDSPVLRPLTRNTASRQASAAGHGSQRAAQPDAAEHPASPLAFVVEPPPGSQRKAMAVPKFHPVPEPAAWPTSSREGRRGPEPGTDHGPRPGPDRRPAGSDRGPEQGSDRGPEQCPDRRPELGTDRGAEGAPERSPADQPGDRAPLPAVIGWASRQVEWVASGLGLLLMRAAALARRHPLEAAAVIVLGLGGLIYPPVWLAGAVLALPSRLWDIKDKLVGLAAPAVLAIVGGAGLATGSSPKSGAAYLHEALVIGGYLIRAGSVLVAAYLAWRVHRGQRQPPPPSWHPPYQ